ncbi:MAG: T9SS type A sorting domain-containing protein [Paludibacteraceae bacterium]|nr:T9SS type A sorting domain-containing protein [Paludibacteraceae bacterium]
MIVLTTDVWGQLVTSTRTWTGAANASWDNTQNWDPKTLPDNNTDVIIPAGLEYYPECTASSVCRNIYLAAGARLGNQYWLTYEKAFVDVSIPTNRYVRITPPLKETYSGDFFTQEQGGEWDEFTAASYEPTEGPTGKNRVYPGATYQSVYSEVSAQRGNYGETSVSTLESGWSDPKNALNTLYQPLQALDVWVDNDQKETATFRFPSEETEYLYFDQHGKAQSFGETTARTDASGKFVYDEAYPDGNMELQYWREAGSEFPLFCIGNPSMAYLDVEEFLKENKDNITPFIYLHNDNEENEGRGTETILYYNEVHNQLIQVPFVEDGTMPETKDEPIVADNNPLRYIKPTQGFRVMSGGTTLHAVEPGLIGSTKGAECTYRTREIYTTNGSANPSSNYTTSDFVMSIAVDPNDPTRIEICNLANQGNVLATIDPENKTITIKNGTPIRFIDNSWSNLENTSSGDILYIYGCDPTMDGAVDGIKFSDYVNYGSIKPSWFTTEQLYTKYVTNLGKDIVFEYNIEEDKITLEQINPFVIYSKEMYEAIKNNTTPNIPYKKSSTLGFESLQLCVAHFVYDQIRLSKENPGDEGFILSQAELDKIEGKYESNVYTNRSVDGITQGSYRGITLQHIKGTRDQIYINGIFPNARSNVMGTIKRNGNSFSLFITQGQIVNLTNPDDPSQNYHLYLLNGTNRTDLELTWDASLSKWSATNQAQISRQNSNDPPYLYLREQNNRYFSLTHTGGLDSDDGDASIENEITASQNKNLLTLEFTPSMFVTNPSISPSATPQQRKVQAKEASSLITITAQGEEYSGSTLLVKSEKGRKGYSNREDAPLADISEQKFCMASLAGEQVVGVNVFDEIDIIPLYIKGEAQALTLHINNIEALGWEAELYDAVEESSTAISAGQCAIEIQLYGDQAAGRFFIRKKSGVSTPGEATGVEEGSEWSPAAWSPAKGSIVIMSQEAEMSTEVMVSNMSGQTVVYEKANSIHTLRNLLPGVYVVQLRNGNKYWNKKLVVE